MRKITKQCAAAFHYCREIKVDNTRVFKHDEGYWCLTLHGNLIAKKGTDGSIWISNAGWFTPTTKERLNGLLKEIGSGCGICQRKGQWYIVNPLTGNTIDWNGWWIQIKD